MIRNQKPVYINGRLLFLLILLNGVIIKHAYTENRQWFWACVFTLPLVFVMIRKSLSGNDDPSRYHPDDTKEMNSQERMN